MVILYSIIYFSFIGSYTFIKTHFPSSIICLSSGIVLKELGVLMSYGFSLFTNFQNNKPMNSLHITLNGL